MTLGRMEVGLGPGNFVLDGDPAPPVALVERRVAVLAVMVANDTVVDLGRPARARSCTPQPFHDYTYITPPFPQIDIIGAVVIVWRVRGKLSGLFCAILCATIVHSAMHTHMNRLTVLWIGFSLTGPISLC